MITVMFVALVSAQVTSELSQSEQTELKNAVDLTANFFKGFGKSSVASDIYTAYHIMDGEFTVTPKEPCGSDDIENMMEQLVTLYQTYDQTGCLTDSSEQSFCPTVMHPEDSTKWMNDKGISQEIQGMISTIQDYFNKCVIPKIENDLESEAISVLK
jgi:hypothetical protein